MLLLLVLGLLSSAAALDNGLALTPPMGWLTWERFRCITDCQKYPKECISEDLVKRTADLLVSEGYLDAGYEYLGIDDCWLEKERGPDGHMVPDRHRFPNGMKYIADYLHNKGLKFGLYQDYGNRTCAGYPGVLGHERGDTESLLQWEVDYLKLDGCYINQTYMDEGYPAFGKLLNDTGRPIVYSCSWPAYQEPDGIHADYASIAKHCNLWRNWDDIDDSWTSMVSIMNWFGDNQDRFASFAGPGHWNDPDMGSRIEIWKRDLYDGSYAVAFVSQREDGTPYAASFTYSDITIPEQEYTVKDLYHEEPERTWAKCRFETRINPLGVKFYKLIPKKSTEREEGK